MQRTIIYTPDAPKPIGPYSQAILVNGTLYISGQIAIYPESGEMVQTNISVETKQVMRNIEAILKAAGMGFAHVVKCSIFISDMNDFSAINEVYATYFPSNPPARETVQVSKLPKGANVEISLIAVK